MTHEQADTLKRLLDSLSCRLQPGRGDARLLEVRGEPWTSTVRLMQRIELEDANAGNDEVVAEFS